MVNMKGNMSHSRIYLFLTMTMALTGCVETIVMDSNEDLPVMVNCILESGEMGPQTLWLQYVKGKSASEYTPITDAEVYLQFAIGGTPQKIDFMHVEGSKWETDSLTLILSGMTYSLTVKVPGRDVITSHTTIPRIYSPSSSLNTKDGTIEWWLSDYSGEPSVPVWLFVGKGKHRADEAAGSRYPLLVTDNPYADDFNVNGQKFSDLEIEGNSDGEFLHLTWPAFKNMRKMYPDLPLHDGFIRIDHMDGNKFHLLAGPLKYRDSYQDHIDFYFVTNELDRYLRDVYVKDKSLDHDLTEIYSMENAWSNIDGGAGIISGVFRDNRLFLENAWSNIDGGVGIFSGVFRDSRLFLENY